MTESRLAALHEDALYAEQRKRLALGFFALFAAIAVAFVAAVWLIRTSPDTIRFTFFVIGLCVDLYAVVLVSIWTTQPAQERARRRRLVKRQALGTLPSEDE